MDDLLEPDYVSSMSRKTQNGRREKKKKKNLLASLNIAHKNLISDTNPDSRIYLENGKSWMRH